MNSWLVDSCSWLTLFLYNIDNFVDGAVLCQLTEQEIREIIPPIGLAKKVHSMLPKLSLHELLPIAYHRIVCPRMYQDLSALILVYKRI